MFNIAWKHSTRPLFRSAVVVTLVAALGTTLFTSSAGAGPVRVDRADHIAFDFEGEPCPDFSANDIMITMHGDWSQPGAFSVWNVTVTNNRRDNAIVSMSNQLVVRNPSGHVAVDFPRIPPGQSHVMQIVRKFDGDGVVVDFPAAVGIGSSVTQCGSVQSLFYAA
ncbi:hypothetical protein LZG04_27475 [Saccharothrix sp. S26]|uniref:hypothetical protein n=1 Tax=Saccharothrix sp. S26 TaxID=2907215 RepID=UPI001F3F1B24|nr:hypothetical protein [Saccharothrix sp. S26]MCE6998514.1 hypothetical protein [Saccharothrix sp. S26]